MVFHHDLITLNMCKVWQSHEWTGKQRKPLEETWKLNWATCEDFRLLLEKKKLCYYFIAIRAACGDVSQFTVSLKETLLSTLFTNGG